MRNADFTDVDSTFDNVAGINGGSVFVEDGTLSMTNTEFKVVKGRNGGSIKFEGEFTVTFNSINVENTYANYGGFLHAEGNTASTITF